jgi:hypothetical protein
MHELNFEPSRMTRRLAGFGERVEASRQLGSHVRFLPSDGTMLYKLGCEAEVGKRWMYASSSLFTDVRVFDGSVQRYHAGVILHPFPTAGMWRAVFRKGN